MNTEHNTNLQRQINELDARLARMEKLAAWFRRVPPRNVLFTAAMLSLTAMPCFLALGGAFAKSFFVGAISLCCAAFLFLFAANLDRDTKNSIKDAAEILSVFSLLVFTVLMTVGIALNAPHSSDAEAACNVRKCPAHSWPNQAETDCEWCADYRHCLITKEAEAKE